MCPISILKYNTMQPLNTIMPYTDLMNCLLYFCNIICPDAIFYLMLVNKKTSQITRNYIKLEMRILGEYENVIGVCLNHNFIFILRYVPSQYFTQYHVLDACHTGNLGALLCVMSNVIPLVKNYGKILHKLLKIAVDHKYLEIVNYIFQIRDAKMNLEDLSYMLVKLYRKNIDVLGSILNMSIPYECISRLFRILITSRFDSEIFFFLKHMLTSKIIRKKTIEKLFVMLFQLSPVYTGYTVQEFAFPILLPHVTKRFICCYFHKIFRCISDAKPGPAYIGGSSIPQLSFRIKIGMMLKIRPDLKTFFINSTKKYGLYEFYKSVL